MKINMNQEQMEYRCLNSRPLGKVSLLGYRFIINSRGVATIILIIIQQLMVFFG